MFQAVGAADAFLLWAVLASFIASGVTTLLQAIRVGPVGAGYILTTGPPGMAISVSVMAVAAGGPALLATLVFVMALFQFVFSARLSLFRRLLTPTITGTVLMLVPVPVMPIIFNQLKNVPDGTPALAAPLSALATLLVAVGIMLKATGPLRLWAPGIALPPAQRLPAFSVSTTSTASPRLRGLACRGPHGRVSISTSGRLSGDFCRRFCSSP